MQPLVIFLNGTSSSGKTSIARELQALYQTPLLHTGIDTLYNMLPEKSVGEMPSAALGYRYIMRNGVLDHIQVGEYAEKLLACTVPMTQVLLEKGNDLVIDEILFAGEERLFLYAYAAIFASVRAYFIRIECALEILEAREAKRPDRHRGVARSQYGNVHNHGYVYDLTVDSGVNSPAHCAQAIMAFIQNTPQPEAFSLVRARKRPVHGN